MDEKGANYLGAYLSDDFEQSSHVQVQALPAGWRAISSLLYYFQTRADDEVCLLEEPETHLHPALQRTIVRSMCEVVRQKRLQIFIATHSMTFQSRFAWQDDIDVRYFEADAHELRVGIQERAMLDSLGISGAELGTSNGVVWVEGPSDRLYYKHWIGLLCRARGIPEPIEHVDYCFAFHGGSILTHFTPGTEEKNIDVSRLNRHFTVIVDRDLDAEAPDVVASTKDVLEKWIQGIASPKCRLLRTPGYTIESSLPYEFRKTYFRYRGPRLRLVRGKKVVIAQRYCSQYSDWEGCFDPDKSMEALVGALVDVIRSWQQ